MGSSKRKKKPVVKELICNRCETKLNSDQIYCYECGEPTAILKNNLSASKSVKRIWQDYQEIKSHNYLFAIFYFFVLLVPLIFLVQFTYHNYYLQNLLLLFFLPLLFIPFSIVAGKENKYLTIKSYFYNLRHYPKYFLFILLNIVYFFLLRVITTSVDPILNLVRLIMVLYWLSIVVPLPSLIANKNINTFRAWWKVYIGGKETRWQQFYIYLFLSMINIVGLAILGLGLLVTIPFSFIVIDRYFREMDNNKLFME